MNELHHFSLFIRQKIAALLRPVFLSLEIQFSDRLKAAGEGLKAYCKHPSNESRPVLSGEILIYSAVLEQFSLTMS